MRRAQRMMIAPSSSEVRLDYNIKKATGSGAVTFMEVELAIKQLCCQYIILIS